MRGMPIKDEKPILILMGEFVTGLLIKKLDPINSDFPTGPTLR
jgi:hypothetical protein